MISIVNYQNIVSLSLSDEADRGSGGDQPARNNLTECNGTGDRKFSNPNFLLQSFMPKKTHCFDRNKSEYMTIINTKNGQRIPGQDNRVV